MTLALYAHPFSSYCQKVLVALYENDIAFELRMLGPDDPTPMEELKAVWPIGKFPVLMDDGAHLIEATIIVEHLDVHHAGRTRLIPENPAAALEARFMDRFFDNYVSTPVQALVDDAMREEGDRDPLGPARARAMLDTAYAWLDARIADRQWAAGETFGLADCAAAPALFYSDWSHPIGERFANVTAYRRRLLERPSFARAVDEARPYRHLFPLGAPDRD